MDVQKFPTGSIYLSNEEDLIHLIIGNINGQVITVPFQRNEDASSTFKDTLVYNNNVYHIDVSRILYPTIRKMRFIGITNENINEISKKVIESLSNILGLNEKITMIQEKDVKKNPSNDNSIKQFETIFIRNYNNFSVEEKCNIINIAIERLYCLKQSEKDLNTKIRNTKISAIVSKLIINANPNDNNGDTSIIAYILGVNRESVKIADDIISNVTSKDLSTAIIILRRLLGFSLAIRKGC